MTLIKDISLTHSIKVLQGPCRSQRLPTTDSCVGSKWDCCAHTGMQLLADVSGLGLVWEYRGNLSGAQGPHSMIWNHQKNRQEAGTL